MTRRRRRTGAPEPNAAIRSAQQVLVFVMTTLALYLLPFFRAPPACACQGAPEDVPLVRNMDPVPAGPILTVTPRAVLLDGSRVFGLEQGDVPPFLQRLNDRLEETRRMWPVLHPSESFEGDIVLQVHRQTRWRTLRRLAQTLERTGHTRWNLVVAQPMPPVFEQY